MACHRSVMSGASTGRFKGWKTRHLKACSTQAWQLTQAEPLAGAVNPNSYAKSCHVAWISSQHCGWGQVRTSKGCEEPDGSRGTYCDLASEFLNFVTVSLSRQPHLYLVSGEGKLIPPLDGGVACTKSMYNKKYSVAIFGNIICHNNHEKNIKIV